MPRSLPSPPKPVVTLPETPRTTLVPGVNYRPGGVEYGGPKPVWKKRASKLLARMNNRKAIAEMQPFLRDAEQWLEASMLQLSVAAGGVCGPIESNALAAAAWQMAYSRYWMMKATEDPSDIKLVEVASRLADSARQNSLTAYDLAVRLFRAQPQVTQDPLAALEAQDQKNSSGAQELRSQDVPSSAPSSPLPEDETLPNEP